MFFRIYWLASNALAVTNLGLFALVLWGGREPPSRCGLLVVSALMGLVMAFLVIGTNAAIANGVAIKRKVGGKGSVAALVVVLVALVGAVAVIGQTPW